MLRKFRVNVSGKEYLVELEELGGAVVAANPAPAVAVAPVANPAPAVAVAPVANPAPVPPAVQPAPPTAPTGGITIEAPMPGNILKVMVKVGDQVAYEQPLAVLEAMKMENELVAPKAGVVTGVYVSANAAVDAGEPIVTIE